MRLKFQVTKPASPLSNIPADLRPNKERRTDKTFSNTEVGVLIESLRTDFRTVAEVVAPVRDRLTAVKERLSAVENRLTGVEDVVRVVLPSLSTRVSALETKAGV